MWDWSAKLAELTRSGRPVAVVTVIAVAGSVPREVGAKMLITATGERFGSVGGGHLERIAGEDALACLAARAPRTVHYPLGPQLGQCCGGVVDVLIEVVNAGPRLILFGAGHVGQALCRVLQDTPFRVDLIDERPEWIEADGIPAMVTRHATAWDLVAPDLVWDAELTYVAIMTHRHDVDQDIVQWVLQQPAKYVGLIGSQTKWAKFRARLGERGVTLEQLARVKCPIGVEIGGKSPGEVAVSVAAEIIRVFHGRPSAA